MVNISTEILYSTSFKERIPTEVVLSIFILFLTFGWNFLLNQNILDPTIPAGLPPFMIFFHFAFYISVIFVFSILFRDIINYQIVFYNSADDLLIIKTRIFRDKIIYRKEIDYFHLINKEGQKMKEFYIKRKKSWVATGVFLAMGEGEDVSIFLQKLQKIYSDIPFKRIDPID